MPKQAADKDVARGRVRVRQDSLWLHEGGETSRRHFITPPDRLLPYRVEDQHVQDA